eukprot:CAMPEP_0114139812 /NCGR_PEP_ID=MMETSP0043_2-20121206/17053_1 /TAXON_ID=464988 /ORGANISM="Hemiselmis andersenii, Strain CCMP644" /LENGTH=171 /DNA_ID=CAMNT_0001233869 /DNA_START=99 /DNA_END=614 /DNA_ORIENTATION=+
MPASSLPSSFSTPLLLTSRLILLLDNHKLPPLVHLLLRQEPQEGEDDEARQVCEHDEEREVGEVRLRHPQRLCGKPPHDVAQPSREVVDAHQRCVQCRLDLRGADAGPQNQNWHECYLPEHRQHHIIPNSKPRVWKPNRPVRVGDEDEGRHAQDDGGYAHVAEEDAERHPL